MRIFPDKVEGKIFLLVLIISMSVCLLATRLIVISQEDSVLSTNRARLSTQSGLFADQIEQSLEVREKHALAFNRSIARVIERAEAGTRTPADGALRAELDEVKITGPDRATWSNETNAIARAVVDSIARMKLVMHADFDRIFVRLIQPGITIESIAKNSSGPRPNLPIDVDSVSPAYNTGQQPVWTTLESEDAPGQLWARILVPLHVGGRFVGVAGGEYPLESDLKLAGLRDRDGFGSLLVIDRNGKPLAESDARWPKTALNAIDKTYGPDEDPRIAGTPFSISLAGGSAQAYVTSVDKLGWRVAAIADNDIIYAQLTALKWKLTLSALVLALILVLLLRASFRQLFIKRVLSLEQATRAFAQHGIANFPDLGNDEIGGLVHAFEEMVESLASREAELTIRNQQLKNEISGRLSAVESLRESERKFRTLFDKSSDAVLVFDGERYIDCNEAAIEMLGFSSKAQLLSAAPSSFSPPLQRDGRPSIDKELEMIEIARRKGVHRYEWVCESVDKREFWVEVVLTVIPYGGREVLYTVWRDISDRKLEEEERVRLTTALEQAAEVIIVTDTDGTILYVNPSFERQTQYSREEVVGKHNDLIHADEQDGAVLEEMRDTIRRGKVWKGRIANTRKDGTLYQAETTISPVRDATGAIINYVVVSYDVTKEATLEAQLIQAQKMEAIGELASGIAHEINTPTQYIGDNIRFFHESFQEILKMLNRCEELVATVRGGGSSEPLAEAIDKLAHEIDLEYLKEEIPIAIEQSIEGNARVAEIVRAMKEFAHPGIEEKTAIDVNHAIQNTLAVARNEWKYVAEIQLDLDDHLPEVPCLPSSFNQVILNIVVNASHAIADVVGDGAQGKGTITIATRSSDGWAEISISDTGTGIPEQIRNKIFDPFFTTKGVGKGTGQGLALVHTVIVEKHGGTISVESTMGKGTTFIIRLPLAEAVVVPEDAELAAVESEG